MAIKQTIPSNTNANKTLTLGNFKGIDASSSPFEVNGSRATYCQNLINENGVNHKRPGWRTIKIFDGAQSIFHFKMNGGNRLFVVSLIESSSDSYLLKRTLYGYEKDISECVVIAEKSETINSEELTTIKSYGFDFKKMQCFLKGGNAYIVGGGSLIIIHDDEIDSHDGMIIDGEKGIVYSDAYIPTTTISINRDSEETATRKEKEHANLLSKYRKNTLIGVKASSSDNQIETV